jgi:hypothetical protein
MNNAGKHLGLAWGLLLAAIFPTIFPAIIEAEEVRPSVRIVWSESVPEIDGHLDDPVWAEAALVNTFLQVTPVPGAQPSQRTDVRILTDGKFIYFGIRCHDTDPKAIVANLMLRDSRLWQDDRIVVGLDTFNDHRNGYAFEVNPRGSRHDVLVEGDAFNSNWQTLWFAKASIDSGGWSVEIAIPFHSLNFDPETDVWGINFSRGIRRNNERIRWSDTQPQRFVSDFGVAGTLEGMLGIEQGLGITLTPSATATRVNEHDGSVPENAIEPSVNAFYNFLPSVVASFTANTNFAETEVDDRQVNLGRSGLFFPEKRDFFLQDALIFSFADYGASRSYKNGLPFYSRKMGIIKNSDGDSEAVDILAGGKVTGRLDQLNFGLMDVVLDAPPGEKQKNLVVGRLAMNVLEESTLGAIFTHGDPTSDLDNSLFGVDFNYSNSDFNGDQTLMGQAWFSRSFTEGETAEEWSYGALMEYPNDRTNWKVGIAGVDKNYNPGLGFVDLPRERVASQLLVDDPDFVDRQSIRRYSGSYRNRIRRDEYIRTIDSKVIGYLITDEFNEIDSAQFNFIPLTLQSEIGDYISLAYRHDYKRIRGHLMVFPGVEISPGGYSVDRAYMRIDTSHNRAVQGAIQVTYGGFYGGTSTSVSPEISWRPNYHWLFKLEYQLNDAQLPEGDFKAHLLRARVNVQFTPNLAWITVAQWENFTNSASINSRVHWIIEDGREVFLVFNQGLDTEGGITATRSEPLIKLEWSFRF